MSKPDSLDDKPVLARARPLVQGSTAAFTSTRTSSCDADSCGSDESSQERKRSTVQDGDIGVPIHSVPSIFNSEPRRPHPPPPRRNCGFSLSQTVVAKTIQERMLSSPDRTDGSRTRTSEASSHYPAGLYEKEYTTHQGDSQTMQTDSRSQSPLLAARQHCGPSYDAAATRDEVEPCDVTPEVFVNGFTGKLSKRDRSRIAESLWRALVGGNG